MVQQVLGEADWRTLDAAFAENRDPLTGHPPSHEYEQLFSRTFRTEVLDAWLFNSIEQVQAIADDWLTQYNEYRPHDALGGVPPKQFMPRLALLHEAALFPKPYSGATIVRLMLSKVLS